MILLHPTLVFPLHIRVYTQNDGLLRPPNTPPRRLHVRPHRTDPSFTLHKLSYFTPFGFEFGVFGPEEKKDRLFPKKKKILVEVAKMMKDQYFECRGSENVLRIKLAKVVVK